MKYLSFFFFLLSGILFAQEIEITPELHSATVYLNTAKLSYSADVSLPKGNTVLVFKGLSPYLIPESMVLKGVGKASIVNISYRNNFLVNKRDNAKIRELKKEWEAVARKVTALEAQQIGLKHELEILKVNSKLEKPSLGLVQQFVDYYKKRFNDIQKQIFEINLKLEPLQEKRDKLQKQIKELQGRAKRKAKDMVVTLSVPASQNFKFYLEYLTRRAGWQPSYNIRSEGAGKDLNWQFQAEVKQNTGIDWYNIPVTLSTLRPQFHLQIPQPNPWYLYPYKPASYAPKSKIQPLNVRVEANMDAAEEVVEIAAEENIITESDLDVQYTLKSRYDILSGSEPVLVQLKQFTTPGEYKYYAVPYQNQTAFLMVKVKNLSPHRLVPGKARLYYQDRYTGETYINPHTEKDELLLAFGNDSEITVKRKQTQNFKDYQTFGNKVLVKREYTITIKNNKRIPVQIEVKDRVPISQDEKIEVKNVRISPEGNKDKNGIVTWHLNLNPGETSTMKIYFEVKYPKDYSINL